MSSEISRPCAACKVHRRKCTQDCIFAPYFPPNQILMFMCVQMVYGASNVSKLLQEVDASQRQDTVDSLVYQADCRIRDPVYGCVSLVYALQQQLKKLRRELDDAKTELATFIGPQQLPSVAPQLRLGLGQPSSSSSVILQQQLQEHNMVPNMDISAAEPHEKVLMGDHPLHHQPQPQTFEDHQQLASDVTVTEQQGQLHQHQELFRAYGGVHQQNQQDDQMLPEIMKIFDSVPSLTTTDSKINQMSSSANFLSPSSILDSFETPANESRQVASSS